PGGVEPMGPGHVGGDGLVDAPGPRVHDPLCGWDHLQPAPEVLRSPDHVGRHVEHEARLVPVGGGPDDLSARLVVAHQEVEGQGGSQMGLPVLAGHLDPGRPVLPETVGPERPEDVAHDPLLPRAEVERLASPLTLAMAQGVDETNGALPRVDHRVSSSSSSGSFSSPGGFTSRAPRLYGSRPNRLAHACRCARYSLAALTAGCFFRPPLPS